MTQRVSNNHKARSIIHIQWSHEDNPIKPSSSSAQWICGDVPAMDGQWQSWRIVSVRTNRVFKQHAPWLLGSTRILVLHFLISLCVMNQFRFNQYIYAPWLVLVEHLDFNINNVWTPPLAIHGWHVTTKQLRWWGG